MLANRHSFPVRFVLLTAILALVSTVGIAQSQGGPAPRGTARYEQWLTEEVNHRLLLLPRYSVFDYVQYKVNGSEVTLQGQVISDVMKRDAEYYIKRIEGVTKVTNNIEILPASPNDDRIRRATFRVLSTEPALEKYRLGLIHSIHIIVKNGHVTLEGTVLNEGDKTLAGVRAKNVSGVFSVTNNLRIETSKTQSS